MPVFGVVNIMQNKTFELETLAEAFEKGYQLGRSDGREGVFIDMPSLVAQFADSLTVISSKATPTIKRN